MNYTDLLGVSPNIMMLITGACGDGKAILLWLDTMTMHIYRKKEYMYKLAQKQYDADMKTYSDWNLEQEAAVEGEEPTGPKVSKPKEPKEVDELYDAGSMVGLGQMMKATEGRAVWLKHEARKLLKK